LGDDVANAIQRLDGGDEHADLLHRSRHTAGGDEVADTERTEDLQEHACREVAQHAAPGGADGHTGTGQKGGETGGLDAEEAQDRDHQDDPEDRPQNVDQIADDRGVKGAGGQPSLEDAQGKPDAPATGNPEGDGTRELEQKGDDDTGHQSQVCRHQTRDGAQFQIKVSTPLH